MRFSGPGRQIRYNPQDRSSRKEYDPDFQPVMIGDMRRRGEVLEVECKNCGRHGFYDLTRTLPQLRDDIPVYLAAMFLVCSNCGARNADDANPAIWAHEAGGKVSAPQIDRLGRKPTS